MRVGAAVRVGPAGDAVLGLASARRRRACAPHAAQAALPRRARLRRVQTRARARAIYTSTATLTIREVLFSLALSFATNAGVPLRAVEALHGRLHEGVDSPVEGRQPSARPRHEPAVLHTVRSLYLYAYTVLVYAMVFIRGQFTA